MDINVLGVLAIGVIYLFWRLYHQRLLRNKEEMLRARVAWMLWVAANHIE